MSARHILRLTPALCAAVGIESQLLAAEPPASLTIANPGFEEDARGWSRREVPTDPAALAVDSTVKHSGAASARIAQADVRSYSSLYQLLPCQPDTDYIASAFVRASGVERRGIGINLFIGDRQGLTVGRPIPPRFRAGTYDWTRVAVPFNSRR